VFRSLAIAIALVFASAIAACHAARPDAAPSGDSPASAATIEAGAALRKITPSVTAEGKPVWLAGYGPGRRATAVNDDLFARALVIRDRAPGGGAAALCVLDLVGFFRQDVLEVREALRERGVSLDAVIVASTHTHSGPDTMGLWGPMFGFSGLDPAYNAFVREQCVLAISEAVSNLRPASARLAVTETKGLVNDSRLPRVLDEPLRLLAFDDAASGRAIATLVNWSCHPECLPRESTLVSADFCAPLLRRIEAERGGVGIFAAGVIGGLMTPGGVRLVDPQTGERVPEDTWRHAEVLGERLARIALDALASARPLEATPIGWRSREVDVPLENEIFRNAAALGVFADRVRLYSDGRPDDSADEVNVFGKIVRRPKGRDLRTEVGLLSLGEASVLCIPGEIYPELVFGGIEDPPDPGADFPDAPTEPLLEPMLPPGPHFYIGLANDEIGYILPRRQWDTRPPFAYGRKKAQYGEINSVGPSAAAAIAEAVADLVSSP
jgi:hypothetical protein